MVRRVVDVVCVVGMSRSGTSALTRVLGLAGVHLGRGLAEERGRDNPSGYWEFPPFRQINESILKRFDGSWAHPPALPPGWEMDPILDDLYHCASTELEGFSGHRLWGWKDPRTSITLPFWNRVLPHQKFVICVRNPVSVANSIVKRNRLPVETALDLWFEYNVAALVNTDPARRVIVHYESLLEDWSGVVKSIGETLGLPLASPEDIRDSVEEFIDPSKRSFSSNLGDVLDSATVNYRCKSLYTQLLANRASRETPTQELNLLARSAARDLLSHATWENAIPSVGSGSTPSNPGMTVTENDKASGEPSEQQSSTQAARMAQLALDWQIRFRHEVARLGQELDDAVNQKDAALLREGASAERARLVQEQTDAARRDQEEMRQSLEDSREERSQLERVVSGMRAEVEALSAHVHDLQLRNSKVSSHLREASWLSLHAASRILPGGVREAATRAFFKVVGRISPESVHLKQHRETRRISDQRPPPAGIQAFEVPTDAERHAYDVLIFPVIDWHFRYQRPQQLAKELGSRGHRVFYFSSTFDGAPGQFDSNVEFVEPNVCLVSLPGVGRQPVIYAEAPSKELVSALHAGIRQLRDKFGMGCTVSIVNHPFWAPIVAQLENNIAVYDCMDNHAGFSNTTPIICKLEEQLLRQVDRIVCTSRGLQQSLKDNGHEALLLPNGADEKHFRISDEEPRVGDQPVVGYFGAIAEWFDCELVAEVARELDEWRFVLVGSTHGADIGPIAELANVEIVGEVPYQELPNYLARFDVCMIPFKLTPLTLATNPVKVYEYLSGGKPVVATRLPELEPMKELVTLADSACDFVDGIRVSLSENSPGLQDARRRFASANSWTSRADLLEEELGRLFPKIGIVILTYNQLEFTKACLHSIGQLTRYPNWEMVIVDNASTDGTPEFLQEFSSASSRARVILNHENRGVAAGFNQGVRSLDCDYLVLMNNDTHVTPGWLGDLLAHFRRDPHLGLLNPCTNNIGNEARIDIEYHDMAEMIDRARAHTRSRRGRYFELPVAALFCAMVPREIWDEAGGLDEGYEVGFFEDDDFAIRVRRCGYKVACAEDVFVHHHLSASFGVLERGVRDELFERNKRYYESKWGAWIPHAYREQDRF